MKGLVLLFAVCASQVAALSGSRMKSLLRQTARRSTERAADADSLVAGMFDVSGFDAVETSGSIQIKIRVNNPTKIHLSKEQQEPGWQAITDPNSPMQSGKWRLAANGFRFQNEIGQQLHCSVRAGRQVPDALLVGFDCVAHEDQGEDEPRFARIASSFWQPCPDGHVPYGWQSQWGEFDYPYYSVTNDGFLGCAAVSSDGYCFETKDGAAIHANFGYNDSPTNKPTALFPFDSFQSPDLLPGSKFGTPSPRESSAHTPAASQPAPPPISHASPASEAAPVSEREQPRELKGPYPGSFSTASPPFSIVAPSQPNSQASKAAENTATKPESVRFSTSSPPFSVFGKGRQAQSQHKEDEETSPIEKQTKRADPPDDSDETSRGAKPVISPLEQQSKEQQEAKPARADPPDDSDETSRRAGFKAAPQEQEGDSQKTQAPKLEDADDDARPAPTSGNWVAVSSE